MVPPILEQNAGKASKTGQARDERGRWTSGLGAAVAAALARSSGVVRVTLGPVRRVRDLEKLTGVNLRGFKHSLTNQGIAHALVMHGSLTNEAVRGQIAITAADFVNIADIVKSPDAVSLGSPSRANGQPRIIVE